MYFQIFVIRLTLLSCKTSVNCNFYLNFYLVIFNMSDLTPFFFLPLWIMNGSIDVMSFNTDLEDLINLY